MNRLLLAVPVAALLCIPAAARAQINGSLDVTPPVIQITPASQTISVDSVRVAVFWSDETMLDASSRIITLNGVNVTTSFTYTGTTKEATSVATLRLTAAGSYTVEASINDATGNPAAAVSRTYTYTPVTQPTQQVSVSPASQAVRRPLGFNTAESFTVANTGNTGATYTLQGLCSGSVANCSLTHTQVTVPAGASTAVGINYVPVGSAGATGTVSLKASNVANTAITATGTYNVTADTVATRGRQGMPTSRRRLDRDRCAVVSAGDGAALECGDLRLAHGLPPVRLLGRSRAPTLVYSSQHAAPHPVVVSYLQLTGTTRPDTVRGSLLVNGVVYSGKWPGWATDSLRRVAVGFDASTLGGGQSGIYPYTFTVTGTFNNGSPSVTLSSVSSELVVINRRASPFGAGWWLAGVEQILPVDTNRKLWVGGDGSYHVYTYVNDTTWAADSYDRPDTMKVRGNRLVRLLPGRAEVRYTLTGQHVETVDATGRVTTFVWRTDGPGLGSIVMPVAGYSYSFAYANNGGTRLSSVTAPGPAGAPLTTWVATDGSGRVSGITDPDANTVGYGYTGADWRVTSRTNRLNHTTRYTWGEGSKLTSVRIPAAVGDTLVTTFRAEEGQGVAFATSEFSTVVNGPRTDVNDVMFFVLDILGVPYRTNFPVRGDTYIYRTDSRYPGVVTRMDQPNGRIVTSSVDDRGNVIAVTDWSVTGGGRVATTLYEWDRACDLPTRVTSPEGEFTLRGYSSFCQPLWEQPGPDAGRRVIFQYNPLTHATAPGLLASVIQPATRDNAASTETLEYDGRGNVSAVMSALGIRVESVGDVVGRDTLTRQQITATAWEVTRRRFDVMGQDTLTESIGPALNGHPEQRLVVRKRFDAEGNLRSVLRQALPDTARVDTVVTRFQYDMAGRKVVEIAPDLKHDSTFYDPAGNVVRTRSRRGLQTWMRYDTLNRLDRRIVEEYAYAPATREVRLVQNNARVGGWTFPYYANAAGGMFAIAADTATYTYDRMSNLLAADNHDAQVRRSYALNGQLLTDTLRIRTWAELAAGGSFTAHQYVLSYGYDLNGRRTQLTHPLNVAPVNGNTGAAYTQQSYQYEPVRGALSRLTSVLGQHYDFFYNTQGQVDSIGYPGGNGEAMHYDADGRLASRSLASPGIYKPVGPMVIHNPVYTYGDRRGKPTLVSDAGDAEVGGSMTLKYSGLGMLVYSQGTMGAGRGASHTSEQYTYDALGNRVAALVAPATYTAVSTYQKYTGRLITTGPPTSVAFAPDAYSADANVSTYDLAGNAEWFQLDRHGGKNYGITRNYYGGDEKLRASERWTCTVSDVSYTNSTDFSAHCIQPSNLNSATGGAFEEYRYDALGRRIAVRSRREPYCTGASCASTLTRTVWDGDQILYEIRARGATGDAASTLENDAETGAHWGRVAYTHGSGIDRPLDLIRMGYTLQPNDNVNYGFNDFGGPYSIIPFRNWRGVVDAASTSNGRQVPCQSGTACPALIHLPGNSYQAWFSPSQPVARTTWFGSLIEEKLDNTGQMYMRNRYYNPATGRFTQEDPIGLAGGLNVYGFAEGDPVSYDDPFGLCPNPLGRGLGSLQCATQDVIEGAKRLPGALLRGTWRAAKEPLVQMLAFNAFPAARGALAGAARAARLGSAAQGAANAAQALRPRPGMAAAAEAATGELVTAVSGRGALHPTIQGYVDDGIAAGYRGYAGGCAEPRCASALLDAGARTEGAFVTTRGVGGVGSARHGAQFAPCENCAYVLRRAGMTYVP